MWLDLILKNIGIMESNQIQKTSRKMKKSAIGCINVFLFRPLLFIGKLIAAPL